MDYDAVAAFISNFSPLRSTAQAIRASLAASATTTVFTGTVQRLGDYAASAQCRPELGVGSNSWPKPEPSAPL